MEHGNQDSLWNKFFNVDSTTGTGRFVLMIAAFAFVGGLIAWLVG